MMHKITQAMPQNSDKELQVNLAVGGTKEAKKAQRQAADAYGKSGQSTLRRDGSLQPGAGTGKGASSTKKPKRQTIISSTVKVMPRDKGTQIAAQESRSSKSSRDQQSYGE